MVVGSHGSLSSLTKKKTKQTLGWPQEVFGFPWAHKTEIWRALQKDPLESPTWRSYGKLGSMVGKWFIPLVFKGVYRGYNPLVHILLTSGTS